MATDLRTQDLFFGVEPKTGKLVDHPAGQTPEDFIFNIESMIQAEGPAGETEQEKNLRHDLARINRAIAGYRGQSRDWWNDVLPAWISYKDHEAVKTDWSVFKQRFSDAYFRVAQRQTADFSAAWSKHTQAKSQSTPAFAREVLGSLLPHIKKIDFDTTFLGDAGIVSPPTAANTLAADGTALSAEELALCVRTHDRTVKACSTRAKLVMSRFLAMKAIWEGLREDKIREQLMTIANKGEATWEQLWADIDKFERELKNTQRSHNSAKATIAQVDAECEDTQCVEAAKVQRSGNAANSAKPKCSYCSAKSRNLKPDNHKWQECPVMARLKAEGKWIPKPKGARNNKKTSAVDTDEAADQVASASLSAVPKYFRD